MKTDFQTDLEKFLTWFSQVEEIDAQDRLTVLNHVLETGTLDERIITFVEGVLDTLAKTSQVQVDDLRRKLDVLRGAVAGEKIPEISMKKRIVDVAGSDMEQLALRFKEDLQADQAQKNRSLEASEAAETEERVARMRAKLA